jgi:hypothetical protein
MKSITYRYEEEGLKQNGIREDGRSEVTEIVPSKITQTSNLCLCRKALAFVNVSA